MDNKIHIYTDGACSGNPGPAGIGVYMTYNGHKKEISESIGVATNNVAELKAIKVGLEAVTNKDKPIVIYSDSAYCIGMFTKNWEAKANIELIREIQTLIHTFESITFVKVKGHSTNYGNNKADDLAVSGKRK